MRIQKQPNSYIKTTTTQPTMTIYNTGGIEQENSAV